MFRDEVAEEISNALGTSVTEPGLAPDGVEWGTEESTPFSALTLGLGDRFYRKLPTGKFSGRITVTWNGIDKNGIDSFFYEPLTDYPFSYTTAAGRIIAPRRMLTDGGSIPGLLRGVNQFTPWRYAPAYMVHDWLFVAKKCRHVPDTDWTFEETASVMAEAMKTMMEVGFTDAFGKTTKSERNADIVYLMHLAVTTRRAKRVWDDDSTVPPEECFR